MCNIRQADTLGTYGPVFVCQEFVPHICILDLKNIYFTYIAHMYLEVVRILFCLFDELCGQMR